jgi:branched-chain amino acid transport system substrate-binding protein
MTRHRRATASPTLHDVAVRGRSGRADVRRTRRSLVPLLAVVVLLVGGCAAGTSSSPAADPIRIGAVFPLGGPTAGLAQQELDGVRIAADFVNADGGIDGRPIALDVRDVESRADAPAAMAAFRAEGASTVIGAYSSDLSMAASAAANAAGLVYWEAGAVADQLTGQGLPLVFRVGAAGTNLGSNSAAFAATDLAPRLGRTASQLRVAIVSADDAYAQSVADAAGRTAALDGVTSVTRLSYNLALPQWPAVMASLASSRPDVIILASHVPDGIAFREAMLAANLHVGALIGSTMAQCDPDFAGDLGLAAIGVFASDRPTGGFQPGALDASARSVYDRFTIAWFAGHPPTTSSAASAAPSATDADDESYTLTGPVEEGSTAAGPSEEGLSGFAAAWALFHDVLPSAAPDGFTATSVATAARAVDLPDGSLPNGAGLRFSTEPATLGQNELAAAVIWQWQALRSYTFVWPPTYQTGQIAFVPLGQ